MVDQISIATEQEVAKIYSFEYGHDEYAIKLSQEAHTVLTTVEEACKDNNRIPMFELKKQLSSENMNLSIDEIKTKLSEIRNGFKLAGFQNPIEIFKYGPGEDLRFVGVRGLYN